MAAASGMSASDALKEKKAVKAHWSKVLKEALDADSWGQSIEATEQYEKLARLLEMQVPELQMTAEEKSLCAKIAHSVTLRMHTLQGVEASLNDGSAAAQPTQRLTLDEVKALQPVLDDLFVRATNNESFPIRLQGYTANIPNKASSGGDVFVAHDDQLQKVEERGSLLLPPKVRAGQTVLSIVIDKIGLKDAQTYIGAYITVSVATVSGQVLETQDTPKSNDLKPNYVLFGHTVHVQSSVEDLLARDLCLFFEFKHFKPAKKKISTRCFAMLESAELRKIVQANAASGGQQAGAQPICLELYKKPTDFSRRSLSLFTIKQLYLHANVILTKH